MVTQRGANYTDADFRRAYLHTPAETAQSYVQWAERLNDAPGITFGCVLDKFIIPLHPGDLMAVVARPGHGKSSFMAYMAKREAANIIARSRHDKEVVVYVSWEQPVEEIEAFFQSGSDYTSSDLAWGRVSLDVVRRKAIKRPALPIWTIGHSLRDANKKRPPLTVDAVYRTIEGMHDEYKVKPTLILIDYLQIAQTEARGDRLTQVGDATNAIKDLAMKTGAPIIAGVQASRRTDDRADQMPDMADAQWSSEIEQRADKQISVLRPCKTKAAREQQSVNIAGKEHMIDEKLFVVRLLKQRFESGAGTWAMRFAPQTLEMADITYQEIRL